MNIKEKVLKEIGKDLDPQLPLIDVGNYIDLTLVEVGKVIDEWAIKRGLKQDNMPNIAYEELKKELGI